LKNVEKHKLKNAENEKEGLFSPGSYYKLIIYQNVQHEKPVPISTAVGRFGNF
jgi:hypothetical protein